VDSTPSQNHLLAVLSVAEFERISPNLKLVAMPLGEVLHESGGCLQYAYFPTTAIVSLHYVMENGAFSEISGVGNDGVIGVALFMGGQTMTSRAIVQAGGYGYRLPASLLVDEVDL
jgi:hypothetical protein